MTYSARSLLAEIIGGQCKIIKVVVHKRVRGRFTFCVGVTACKEGK